MNCGLGPIQTPLMKQCVLELVPVITKIINFSPPSSTVPGAFKHARLTALLKKAGLRVNEPPPKKKKKSTTTKNPTKNKTKQNKQTNKQKKKKPTKPTDRS